MSGKGKIHLIANLRDRGRVVLASFASPVAHGHRQGYWSTKTLLVSGKQQDDSKTPPNKQPFPDVAPWYANRGYECCSVGAPGMTQDPAGACQLSLGRGERGEKWALAAP